MGAEAPTESVTEEAEDDPTALVATTEYAVEESVPVGVPEITQVVVLILSPTESAGVATQLVMAAPLLLSVVGVTFIAEAMGIFVPVAPA